MARTVPWQDNAFGGRRLGEKLPVPPGVFTPRLRPLPDVFELDAQHRGLEAVEPEVPATSL